MSAPTKQQFETREQWLTAMVETLRPIFKDAGYRVPAKLRISCGWPATGGTRSKNRTIGQCFTSGDAEGVQQIFIHPQLSDPIEVGHVTVHEVLHACLPKDAGHKKPFAQGCKKLNLEGKPTATHAGDDLKEKLVEITDNLGKYPHASLDYSGKKQGTRLLAVRCTQCECVVRMTAKWLDEVGAPTCGCGAPMQEQAIADPDAITLKTLEVMQMFASPDDRFGIMFTKDRKKGQRWFLVDYEMGGRTTYCEDRQECLDTITAIREGVNVYDEPETEAGPDYEVDEFELNHDPFFEALVPDHHLPGWEAEIDGEYNDEDGVTPFGWEEAKGVTPQWAKNRDPYVEDEAVEIVPATRPEPLPETVKMFGTAALRT